MRIHFYLHRKFLQVVRNFDECVYTARYTSAGLPVDFTKLAVLDVEACIGWVSVQVGIPTTLKD